MIRSKWQARAVAVFAWALCLVTVWCLLVRNADAAVIADDAHRGSWMVLHGTNPPPELGRNALYFRYRRVMSRLGQPVYHFPLTADGYW